MSTSEHAEPHGGSSASTTNWLRAAVLGANDGIISVASVVVGVAGAIAEVRTILIGGIAALLAGAFSMAAGEYVSVSSQRDTEQALLEKERRELEQYPEEELEELTKLYQKRGLSRPIAESVARELTAHSALHAHAEVELGIDPHDLTNPWHAAFASFASFTVGGIIPLVPIFLPISHLTLIAATFGAVVLALGVTGILSGWVSGASKARATARVVAGGIIAMAVTYGVGTLFGAAGL